MTFALLRHFATPLIIQREKAGVRGLFALMFVTVLSVQSSLLLFYTANF